MGTTARAKKKSGGPTATVGGLAGGVGALKLPGLSSWFITQPQIDFMRQKTAQFDPRRADLDISAPGRRAVPIDYDALDPQVELPKSTRTPPVDIPQESVAQEVDVPQLPENAYSGLITQSAEQYGVPADLLYKVLETESQFNPSAVSKVGAQGIAQFMPATAKEQGVDPFDPASAIPGSARYLKQLHDKFGNWKLALAAYNAGQGNVMKYSGVPPFKETNNYLSKIYDERWDTPTGVSHGEQDQESVGTVADTQYGLRPDGKPKGNGWLGPLPVGDGSTMTEQSIGVNIEGKETLIPMLIPGLSQEEIQIIAKTKDPKQLPDYLVDKAVQHAKEQIAKGESPFAPNTPVQETDDPNLSYLREMAGASSTQMATAKPGQAYDPNYAYLANKIMDQDGLKGMPDGIIGKAGYMAGATLETAAGVVGGMVMWPISEAARHGTIGLQTAGEKLGIVAPIEPHVKEYLGKEIAESYATLGGLLNPKTKMGSKALDYVGAVIEPITKLSHWIASDIDPELYPNLHNFGATITEAGIFWAGTKLKRPMKVIGGKLYELTGLKEAIETAQGKRKAKLQAQYDAALKNLDSYVKNQGPKLAGAISPERQARIKEYYDNAIKKAEESKSTPERKKAEIDKLKEEYKQASQGFLAEVGKETAKIKKKAEPVVEEAVVEPVTEPAQREVPRPGDTPFQTQRTAETVDPGQFRRPTFEPERRTGQQLRPTLTENIPGERQTWQMRPGVKAEPKGSSATLVENIPGERQIWKIKLKNDPKVSNSTLYSGLDISGFLKLALDPLRNQRGSIDVSALNTVFGKIKKGSLYNSLVKKGISPDDLYLSGLAEALQKNPNEKVNWKELKDVTDRFGIEKIDSEGSDMAIYGPDSFPKYNLAGQVEGTYKENLYTYPKAEGTFVEPHWNRPGSEGIDNVMAHSRTHHRIVEGNKAALHIDELQSKWHDTGSKEGYFDAASMELVKQRNKIIDDYAHNRIPKEQLKSAKQKLETLDKQIAEARKKDPLLNAYLYGNKEGVPDAPFKKTWPTLVLRDAAREAVSTKQRYITWSTGKILSERYPDMKTDFAGLYDKRMVKQARKEFGVKPRKVDTALNNPEYVAQLKERIELTELGLKDTTKPQNFRRQMAAEKVMLEERLKDLQKEVWSIPVTEQMKKIYGEATKAEQSIGEIITEPIARQAGAGAGSSTLYSGIPIDFSYAKKIWGKALDKVPVDKIYRNKKLWKETGIWAAKDGSWRYELPFDKAELRPKAAGALVDGSPVKLPVLLKHKELFDAVPQLKDVTVKVDPTLDALGEFNRSTNTITLRQAADKSTLIHEIQHGINEAFDTFRGGNDNIAFHQLVQRQLHEVVGDLMEQGYDELADVVIDAHVNTKKTSVGEFVDGFSQAIDDVIGSYAADLVQISDQAIFSDYVNRIKQLHGVKKRVEVAAKQADTRYRRIPGEMEARLFEQRDSMSAERRAKEAPWETLDKVLWSEGLSKSDGTTLYSGLDISRIFGSLKPSRLKKVAKSMSAEQLETVRTLGMQAERAGEPLMEHLTKNGMPKEQARQMSKVYDLVKTNNPHSLPKYNEIKYQDQNYFDLQPGEQVTNIGKGSNKKVPIGTRLYQAAKELEVVKPSELTRAFTTAPNKFALMKSPVLKEFYYWWKDANFNRMKEGQLVGKQIKDWAKTFKNKKLREEAGVLYHSLSDSGAKAMQIMGERVNPNAQYKALIDVLEPQFEALFHRINEARVAIGKRKIAPIKDASGKNVYLPFFAQEGFFAKLNEYVRSDGGKVKDQANLVLDSFDYISKRHEKQTVDSTYFNHLKRQMLQKGEKLMLDPLELYGRYSQTALDHIYFSKINATIKELVSQDLFDPKTGKKFNFFEKNPDAAHFLAQWNNAIAGVNNLPVSHLVDNTARKLSRNLTAATLHFSPRTVAVQLTALLPTMTKYGVTPTVKGMMDLFTQTVLGKEKAIRKSKEIPVRVQDVFITELAREFAGTRYQKVRKKLDDAGLWGIKKMDLVAAEITWQTAYNKVKNRMTERDAIRYADEAVVNTQGSGARGDLSPIQTSAIGKAATLWQTYTINHANFIAREVLGIKNPELSPIESAIRVSRYVAISGMITYVFADLLGLTSPQPAPIQEIKEGLKNGDEDAQIAWNVMLEMLQYLPVVSAMKFGSDPLGPVAQLGKETFEFAGDVPRVFGAGTDRQSESARIDALSVGGRMVGVPGSGTYAKYLRARRRGEPIPWAIIGRYRPDSKKSSGGFRSRMKYTPARQ